MMKLSNMTAKLTTFANTATMKTTATRLLAGAALAGAMVAAAPAAQAQRVFVAVGPRYVVPAPRFYGPAPVVVYGPHFYGHPYWHDHFYYGHRDWRR
jgi:hypothetical protein